MGAACGRAAGPAQVVEPLPDGGGGGGELAEAARVLREAVTAGVKGGAADWAAVQRLADRLEALDREAGAEGGHGTRRERTGDEARRERAAGQPAAVPGSVPAEAEGGATAEAAPEAAPRVGPVTDPKEEPQAALPLLVPAPPPGARPADGDAAAACRRERLPPLSRRRQQSITAEEGGHAEAAAAAAAAAAEAEAPSLAPAPPARLAASGVQHPAVAAAASGASLSPASAVRRRSLSSSHRGAPAEDVATVLVIERTKATRKLIQRMLSKDGHRAEVREDCWSAKELLTRPEGMPDVVVCDSALTDANGVPMWSWILSHPTTRQIPVIVMSARKIPNRQLQGMKKRGVRALIAKPVSAAKLLAKVSGAVAVARGQAEPSASRPSRGSGSANDSPRNSASSGQQSAVFESGLAQARRQLQRAIRLCASAKRDGGDGGGGGGGDPVPALLADALAKLSEANVHQPGFLRNGLGDLAGHAPGLPESAAGVSSSRSSGTSSTRSSGGRVTLGDLSGEYDDAEDAAEYERALGDSATKEWLVKNFTDGVMHRDARGPVSPRPNAHASFRASSGDFFGRPGGAGAGAAGGVNPALLSRWDFNVFALGSDEALLANVTAMFTHLRLLSRYGISREKWNAFLLEVRAHYLDNPYHNFMHAADVAFSCFSMLTSMSASSYLSTDSIMALLIGALCHDLEHPGRNNRFLIDTEDELALRYNDRSVLENHHCFVATQILRRPATALFAEAGAKTERSMRSRIVGVVLATDMAHHFDFASTFQQRLQSEPMDRASEADNTLVSKMLIKAADISNVTKPWVVAKMWSDRITQEFFAQGDEARELGLPFEKFMDRTQSTMEGNTLNFVRFVVRPLYRIIYEFLPSSQTALDNMTENEKILNAQLKKEAAASKRGSAASISERTAAAVAAAVASKAKEAAAAAPPSKAGSSASTSVESLATSTESGAGAGAEEGPPAVAVAVAVAVEAAAAEDPATARDGAAAAGPDG